MQYIDVGKYRFEDYPISTTVFNNVPGIYVIHVAGLVLDVGIAEKLAQRISGHDREEDWLRHARWNEISLAFFYEASEVQRLAIEAGLRDFLKPLCGER